MARSIKSRSPTGVKNVSAAMGWAERNFPSPPAGTITASPGFARDAATHAANFPLPHPSRNDGKMKREVPSNVPTFHRSLYDFDNPPRRPVNPLQAVSTDVSQP